MSQEDLGELRKRQWADPSGRRVGSEPWQTKRRKPQGEDNWDPSPASDALHSVIAQALMRIAQAETAAVIDTCTMLKAVVNIPSHAGILTLMEEGHLVPVTVPCLMEELNNQLRRSHVGEGKIPDERRLLARSMMTHAVVIGTRRDAFRDVHAAICLRDITDPIDRAVVAATWRARALKVPLVTDDGDLREEAAFALSRCDVAVMRTESFLDYLDAQKGS